MTANIDQSIIKAIANGDTRAYAQLVDKYKDLVYSLALRMLKHKEEAEEVAQDSFIKVFSALHTFKGDSKFSTWIYKVTYNTCLDRLKKNKRLYNEIAIEDYNYNSIFTIDNALEHMIQNEKKELLNACLNRLPADSSALLRFFYFEELSLDEISKIINIETNTVKVKLFRARKKLAIILDAHFQQHNKSMNYGT